MEQTKIICNNWYFQTINGVRTRQCVYGALSQMHGCIHLDPLKIICGMAEYDDVDMSKIMSGKSPKTLYDNSTGSKIDETDGDVA